ncbi:DUF1904 domain-containing protein [Paenibacillus sp. TRM 82003]|nr:DUF1904 domain-containing protein [Paenibacillus sp. TRM 82003]
MPQLTIRGIGADAMRSIAKPLVEELAALCACGTDNFTVDCLSVTSVFDGALVETYPFVEVAWFERGRETRDRLADAITRHLRGAGVAEVEVAFKTYAMDAYYINGVACDRL